jgi:hypothetical protein
MPESLPDLPAGSGISRRIHVTRLPHKTEKPRLREAFA